MEPVRPGNFALKKKGIETAHAGEHYFLKCPSRVSRVEKRFSGQANPGNRIIFRKPGQNPDEPRMHVIMIVAVHMRQPDAVGKNPLDLPPELLFNPAYFLSARENNSAKRGK